MRLAMMLVALGLCAVRAPAHPLDHRLPRDTLFFLSVNDAPRTAARWRASRWYRHGSDPRMQELRTLGEAWLAQARAAHEEDGKPWPGHLLAGAPGQAVLAVVRGPDGPTGIVLVETGPAWAPPGRGPALLRGDGWLAAAPGPAVFGALPGPGEPTLADDPAFRRVREATGADADLTLWAPPEALREIAAWRPALGSLGALLGGERAIGGLGAGMELREGALVTRFLLLASRKRGLLRVFDVPNRPLPPPALVPRGADSFTTVRLDLGALGRALRDVAPGVDLEGMLEGVGGPVALRFFRGFGEEFTTVRAEGREVLVAEVRSARVRREMASFAGAVSRPSDEGGQTLFVGPDGSGLALLDDRLVAGAHEEDVRAVLRRGAAHAGGIAEDAECREALAALPAKRILLWFRRGPDRADGRPGFWRGQACALVNERDGLSLTHVLLAR